VNAAQADVIDRIGRKMVDVLDRYARENVMPSFWIPRRRALQFSMPPRRSTSRRILSASTIRPTRQGRSHRPGEAGGKARAGAVSAARCQALTITYFLAGF